MPRRIVTGVDATGKSVFISDSEAPGTFVPGSGTMYDVWGVDGEFDAPNDGGVPSYESFFPPAVGFRYIVATFPPDESPELMPAEEAIDALIPGASEFLEADNPGMHTTQTVDIGVVLSGQLWLELDDGAEVQIGPGDIVVQNGTRHAWRNKSSEPCTVAYALVGARKA
jgi:mannose-6-phosphate isomerase-like protein (cupin superfamily)